MPTTDAQTPDLLAQLGLSREELAERLVAKLADDLMQAEGYDDEGEPYSHRSQFAAGLQKAVHEVVDARVAAIAEEHVVPQVAELIANVVLQKTNQWGERIPDSPAMTFVEYIVSRADAYMAEQVDREGKPKPADAYNWKAEQTRACWLIDRHLSSAIATSMKAALVAADNAIAAGVADTVKAKLAEIATSLKVAVTSG